jgi:hypothetical protein
LIAADGEVAELSGKWSMEALCSREEVILPFTARWIVIRVPYVSLSSTVMLHATIIVRPDEVDRLTDSFDDRDNEC